MKKTCFFAITEMNNTWILFRSIVYYVLIVPLAILFLLIHLFLFLLL